MLFHCWVSDLFEVDDYVVHWNFDWVHEVWCFLVMWVFVGMSYVGDWEKCCVELIHEVVDLCVVFWVDDLYIFGIVGWSC